MSVLVTNLIDRSLTKLMDPSARRYKREAMLQYFNEVQHWFATSLRCLEEDYYFALEANEGAYSYPVNRIQVKKIRVTQSAAPTGLSDYYPLDEMFEDEFTAATSLSRPSGYISHYFARPGWFELVNTPTANIIDGGLITVTRIPVWLEGETNATMELPDFCQIGVQEGMEILARYSGRDLAAGAEEYIKWQARMADLEGKIADPAIDRRASLRPVVSRARRGMR